MSHLEGHVTGEATTNTAAEVPTAQAWNQLVRRVSVQQRLRLQDAEDCVQEALWLLFSRAQTHLPASTSPNERQVQDVQKLILECLKPALNAARNTRRRAARRHERLFSEIEDAPSLRTEAGSEPSAAEIIALLANTMPEPLWRCLCERFVEKRSVQTIASEFDCDPKTMSRRIADARRSCREILTERELLNK